MAMLHSPDVACVDTGGSRLISTDPKVFIPGLLDTSKATCDSIVFASTAGGNAVCGVGPGVIGTRMTSDGRLVRIVDPHGACY